MGTPGTAHLVDAYSGASILMANNWQPFVNGLCAAGGLVLSTECCSCLMHSWQEQPLLSLPGPQCINYLTCSADGVHCFGGAARASSTSGRCQLAVFWLFGTVTSSR